MDMEDYGTLMVFIYVNVTVNGNVQNKRVTLMSKQSVTKEQGKALYEAFKKDNGHVTGLCCRWQPDSHFIA